MPTARITVRARRDVRHRASPAARFGALTRSAFCGDEISATVTVSRMLAPMSGAAPDRGPYTTVAGVGR
jgi:hypothetical protein